MENKVHHELLYRLERWSAYFSDTGCLLWVAGTLLQNGYGQISVDGKREYVHRAMLKARGITIPEGWVVDHLCYQRACLNPSHLQVVTHGENSRRARNGIPRRFAQEFPKALGPYEDALNGEMEQRAEQFAVAA